LDLWCPCYDRQCNWVSVIRHRLEVAGFPAAAESFVEGDEIGHDCRLALDELVLRGVERALGFQDVEEGG